MEAKRQKLENDSTEHEPGKEVIVNVPEGLASCSLGFAVDAGGSVTKLVYRSKADYRNGKRIGQDERSGGVLRLRYFRTKDSEGLLSFLRDNCDILESASDGSKEWFITGVHTLRFKKRMEEFLNIRLRILSETDAIYKALKNFYCDIPDFHPLSLSPSPVDHSLRATRGFAQMLSSAGENGDRSYEELKKRVDPVAVAEYKKKLATVDADTLSRELSESAVVDWPCLVVVCGSAAPMFVIEDNGTVDLGYLGSYSTVSGKTFLSLGRLLCGVKNFDELIEMAARGDSNKVDETSDDLKFSDGSADDDDWYSSTPDAMVVSAMGKLTEDPRLVNYSKADLAAGLLNVVCSSIAKLAMTMARQKKVKCVVFNGSLVNYEVVRSSLQKSLLFDSMIRPLLGEESTNFVFLPHPGFVCSLGTWLCNLELDGKNS